MSLLPGSRVGPYEIVAPIGAGGMGEVYRARDSRLDRDVAIKILPELFLSDTERRSRFEREAKTLASLNHPNIAQVHGLEETNGTRALVMELIEGQDLSARIAAGPVPIGEALAIARQIAAALDAAHERGIIHRDLKPANIMLTAAGDVKVLDFGLAKALDPATGLPSSDVLNSPTMTSPATQIGMILGTAAYMSPEQAAGKQVDRRTDLWAFGVVVMEMLTGRQVFDGETVSHVLASVLKDEPDWTALPAGTPAPVTRLLRRCLVKDRRRRFESASDARLELDEALTGPSSETGRAAAVSVRTAWLRTLPWGIAVLALTLAGIVSWRSPEAGPPATVYAALDGPEGYALGEGDFLAPLPTRTPIVFTADGKSLVIQAARAGRPQLFLRSLDRPDLRPIAGTDGAHVPFVSPDGQWIGFWAANELKKVPIEGGTPTTITRMPATLGPNGAVWGPDDVIVFGDDVSSRIMRVPAGGGTPIPITLPPPATRKHVTPFLLPGGTRVLYVDVTTLDANDTRLMVQDIDGGEPRLVARNATDGRLLPTGELVFMRLSTLMIASFDAERGEITGEPVSAMTGVMQSGLRGRFGAIHTGAGMFAVSNQNALVAIRGAVAGPTIGRLAWAAPGAAPSSAEPASAAPEGSRLWIRLSPDGQRASARIGTPTGYEVWIADWQRNVWTQCADCPVSTGPVVWSPDGRQLLLGAGDALLVHTLDRSLPDRIVVREPDRLVMASQWLGDGRMVYVSSLDVNDLEIKVLEPGASTGRTFLPMGAATDPVVSPDGRWMAYTSSRTGQREVVVQAFSGQGSRAQVSAGGGRNAVWSRDGRSVYFLDNTPPGRSGSRLFAVDVIRDGELRPGTPREVLRSEEGQGCVFGRCYDVSSDGKRFLLRERAAGPETSVTRMDLILNWTGTLAPRR